MLSDGVAELASATVRADIQRARVTASVPTSPGYRSVVVEGPELRAFAAMGHDQAFRLFFPRRDQAALTLPGPWPARWHHGYAALPDHARPHLRTYTVRRFDAAAGRLEIELALHGGEGAAAPEWALTCRPGDVVGVRAEGVRYRPTRAGRQLWVGDDTALPAMLTLLETAPGDLEADVLLEVPHRDDVRDLPGLPAGVHVTWLARDNDACPGVAALDEIRSAPRPASLPAYAHVLGESGLVRGVRRHLLQRWGMPAEDVCFVGYWIAPHRDRLAA